MFSKEISNLIKGDNLEVLKVLSQYNPERFKQDVHSVTEKGNSFFILFSSKNNELEYVKGLLELCESFGYDFREKKRPHHEDDVYKLIDPHHHKNSYNYGKSYPLNNKNPEFTPEYITAFAYIRNDETFAFLTEKMGKEKMLQLEKDGWPVLEYAYRKNFTKTIRLLCDYGFNYEQTSSGVTILSLAENDPKLLDLYWEIKNKKENNNVTVMSDKQFFDFSNLFQKHIKEVTSKKSYQADQAIRLIDERKDTLTKEQKEKLLIISLPAADDRVFKSLSKMLQYKQKGPELTNIVLNNIEMAHKHQLLYWLVEDEKLLFQHVKNTFTEKTLDNGEEFIFREPLKDKHGIDKIIEKLSSLNIRPGYKHESDKQKKMVNDTFLGRFQELFKDENILLKEFDNGLTLFEKILFNRHSKENLLKFIDIKPKKSNEQEYSIFKTFDEETYENIKLGNAVFSEEQKNEIKEILNKTWYKEHNGEFNLNHPQMFNIFDNDFFLFNNTIIQTNDIYTNNQKMAMFKALVDNLGNRSDMAKPISTWKEDLKNYYASTRLVRSLYFALSDDPDTKWNSLVLSDSTMNALKNTEFLYELKARQLGEELQQNRQKTVKSKLKL
jgi:hypothetical protein